MSEALGIAAVRARRKLRTEERVALLLQRSGVVSPREIVSQGMRLAATKRERATTVTVHLGDAPLYMVKLGAATAREWSAREIRCCRAVAAMECGVSIAPPLVHSNIRRGELVTRLLDPAVTLHDWFTQNPLFSPPVIDGFAMVLAALTRGDVTANGDVPPAMPWIIAPDSPDRDVQVAELFPHPVQLDAVLDGMTRSHALWRQTSIIHGDVKLDNGLVVGRPDDTAAHVLLIDWELAGLGDPAWDLATALQEFLVFTPADDPSGAGLLGKLMSGAQGRALRRLHQRYTRASGLRGTELRDFDRRVGLYTACRLVQTAIELAAVEGANGPRAQTAIALVAALCQDPDAFPAYLGAGRN